MSGPIQLQSLPPRRRAGSLPRFRLEAPVLAVLTFVAWQEACPRTAVGEGSAAETSAMLPAYVSEESSGQAIANSGTALAKLPDADLLFLEVADRYQFKRNRTYEDARKQLGRLSTQRTFDIVVSRLTAVGAGERENAILLVGRYQRPEVAPLLAKLLQHDPDLSVRCCAAENLSGHDGAIAVEALRTAAGDPSLAIAVASVQSLASIDHDKAVELAERLLARPMDRETRESVIDGLAQCRRKAIVEVLLREYERASGQANDPRKAIPRRFEHVLEQLSAATREQLGARPDNAEQWRDWWTHAEPLLTDDLRLKEPVNPPTEFRDDEYSEAPEGLELRAAVDSSTYRVGDPIRLELELKNNSNRPYRVINPATGPWKSTVGFGIWLTRGKTAVISSEPAPLYLGSYMGPVFTTLAPGRAFRDHICLQRWLCQSFDRPLAEGTYELAIAFDSTKIPLIEAKRAGLTHRWNAKPVAFTIRGPMRTDPDDILRIVGEKAGLKWLQTDLFSRQATRREIAWAAIREFGDSRLKPYLEKTESQHKDIYGKNPPDLRELPTVEFHRN
jgi:hypothetical protein